MALPHRGALFAMTDSLLLFRRERPAPDVPDEHLVSLCAAGNAAALDLLFRRHGDRVYRFLGRLPLVQRQDLEELARATFVEAYRAAGEYADRTSVSVWIIGVAVQVLRRYRASEPRPSAASGELPMATSAAPGSPLSAPVARREGALQRVAREIGELPEDLQLAFVLCDLEEIRGADVARMLGVTRKQLWAQVHAARSRLEGALEDSVTHLAQVAR